MKKGSCLKGQGIRKRIKKREGVKREREEGGKGRKKVAKKEIEKKIEH